MRILLVAVLSLQVTPGLSELVEDAVHLFETGHTEHSLEHRDARNDAERSHPCDTEHGCTGTGHHCHCCAATLGTPPPSHRVRAGTFTRLALRAEATRGPDGYSTHVPRPPSA